MHPAADHNPLCERCAAGDSAHDCKSSLSQRLQCLWEGLGGRAEGACLYMHVQGMLMACSGHAHTCMFRAHSFLHTISRPVLAMHRLHRPAYGGQGGGMCASRSALLLRLAGIGVLCRFWTCPPVHALSKPHPGLVVAVLCDGGSSVSVPSHTLRLAVCVQHAMAQCTTVVALCTAAWLVHHL